MELDLRYGRYIQQVLTNLPDSLKKRRPRYRVRQNAFAYPVPCSGPTFQEWRNRYFQMQDRGIDWVVIMGQGEVRVIEQTWGPYHKNYMWEIIAALKGDYPLGPKNRF